MQKASQTLLFGCSLFPKNSNTLDINHCLVNSPIINPYYGLNFRSTDLAGKPPSYDPGQFVNKLLCDRALLLLPDCHISSIFYFGNI